MRQTDSKQCQEEPLGGPRLPVQTPFCRPGGRPSAWHLPMQAIVTLHSPPLLCGFTACNAFFPSIQMPPPLWPGSYPSFSRMPSLTTLSTSPETPLALSNPPPCTQNFSSVPHPPLVFCLCIDTAGVYILSSNRNHRLEIPATFLQTSQFPIRNGEGAISCSMRKLGLEKVIAGKFETCSGAPKHCLRNSQEPF